MHRRRLTSPLTLHLVVWRRCCCCSLLLLLLVAAAAASCWLLGGAFQHHLLRQLPFQWIFRQSSFFFSCGHPLERFDCTQNWPNQCQGISSMMYRHSSLRHCDQKSGRERMMTVWRARSMIRGEAKSCSQTRGASKGMHKSSSCLQAGCTASPKLSEQTVKSKFGRLPCMLQRHKS